MKDFVEALIECPNCRKEFVYDVAIDQLEDLWVTCKDCKFDVNISKPGKELKKITKKFDDRVSEIDYKNKIKTTIYKDGTIKQETLF